MSTEQQDGHQVFVTMEPDGLYVPVCGCGWRGEKFAAQSYADEVGAEHGELLS